MVCTIPNWFLQVNTLLLHIPLLALSDRQNYSWGNELILVGLGNLQFLQVNPGWAGHPDRFLQVNPGWAGHPDGLLQVNPGWAGHPDGFLQVNPGWAG
jgi:hypothetical protein